MSIRDTLSDYISCELLEGESLASDDNILSDGMVDSVGMMRLVAFIEDRFEFSVPPNDFIVENFQTVEILSDYVVRRMNANSNSPEHSA